MASKKLKVELEVDNSDAKKKAKEVAEAAAGQSGGTPPPTPPPTPSADPAGANSRAAKAAKDAADGLDKAGRSARNLSNGAEESAHSIKDIARSFAGLGIGMSMRFAHQFVKEGSFTDKALTVGESAANLGFMGAKMGGGPGAAIGTLVGAGAGLMNVGKADVDRQKALTEQRAANSGTVRSWIEAREATLAFKATLDALTDSETSLADRQRMVAEEIKKREAEVKNLMGDAATQGNKVYKPDGSSNAEAFAKSMEKLKENAARLDQLREIQNRLAKEVEPQHRNGMSAPDALARIGGDSGGGDWNFRELAANSREQLSVLKSIDSKTGKGETTWQ